MAKAIKLLPYLVGLIIMFIVSWYYTLRLTNSSSTSPPESIHNQMSPTSPFNNIIILGLILVLIIAIIVIIYLISKREDISSQILIDNNNHKNELFNLYKERLEKLEQRITIQQKILDILSPYIPIYAKVSAILYIDSLPDSDVNQTLKNILKNYLLQASEFEREEKDIVRFYLKKLINKWS